MNLIPFSHLASKPYIYIHVDDEGFLIQDNHIYQCVGCNEAIELYVKLSIQSRDDITEHTLTYHKFTPSPAQIKQIQRKLGYL